MPSRGPHCVVFASVLLMVATLGCTRSASPPAEPSRYVSGTYSFSFEYPDSLDLREYIPEAISIGRERGEGFDASVEVVVERGEGSDFEAFVLDRARLACAADGPDLSLSCGAATNRRPFTTAEGIAGTVYVLEHSTTRPGTGELLEAGEYGPVYVIPLAADDAVDAGGYHALLVRAPVALGREEVDESLLRAVAESVRLDAE